MIALGATVQGAMWGAGPFEDIAKGAAPAHDALVEALDLTPGEHWLDVATGTGAVALRAARAGAQVTALDIATGKLATARRLAAAESLPIRFDLGEAEQLPYPTASYDVVSSANGVSFALDAEGAARELARVCRPGGRLGLACLMRATLAERLSVLVGAGGTAMAWGDPGFIRRLLGRWFSLSFSEGDAPFLASSPETAAALYMRCYGPLRFFADRLTPDARAELATELTVLFGRFDRSGRVQAPRPFLLTLGRRLENNGR